VTTRTTTRRFVPTQTVVARTVPAAPQPLYDEAVTAPLADSPQPLYDTVAAPAPVVGSAAMVDEGPLAAPAYRYVYEPDRILVIDPSSGIAVQSIPR
jgi:hypothetical protein